MYSSFLPPFLYHSLTLLFNSSSILPLSSSSFSFRQFPSPVSLSCLPFSFPLSSSTTAPTPPLSLLFPPLPSALPASQTALPTPLGPAAPGRERSQPSSAATSPSFPLVSCLPSLLIRPDPRLLSLSPATPPHLSPTRSFLGSPLTLTSPLPTVLSAWRPRPRPVATATQPGWGRRAGGGVRLSRFASPAPTGRHVRRRGHSANLQRPAMRKERAGPERGVAS